MRSQHKLAADIAIVTVIKVADILMLAIAIDIAVKTVALPQEHGLSHL